jgi:hypothetical protein
MTGYERTSRWLTSCLVVAAVSLSPGANVPVAAGATDQPPATIKQSPDHTELWFDGFIDDPAVAVVEQALREGDVTDLYIRSTGGHVGAGLRLGELVRDTALRVHVVGYCTSSCANYVFTAGKERTIDGFVLWHGSVEQKDLREVYLCGSIKSSLFGHAMPTIAPENRAEAIESWTSVRERQAQFFASIGVNEYITRAGQEPVNLAIGFASGSYTYDVPTMQRFGLEHVQAVEGYGTEAWCAAINKDAKRPIGCVRVTDEMLEFDRARKERGEQCQPDGTLITRPAPP